MQPMDMLAICSRTCAVLWVLPPRVVRLWLSAAVRASQHSPKLHGLRMEDSIIGFLERGVHQKDKRSRLSFLEVQAAGPKREQYEIDDSVVRKNVGEHLRELLPRWFPGELEKGCEPDKEWTGIMGFTRLGDPFVGPVIDQSNSNSESFRGQYIAAGYTGHGMPRAYACAEVVAGMVVAEIKRESWTSPEWLPRRYLTFIRDGTGR